MCRTRSPKVGGWPVGNHGHGQSRSIAASAQARAGCPRGRMNRHFRAVLRRGAVTVDHVGGSRGKHLGPTPFVHSPGFLPDSRLMPRPRRRLEAFVRAKGVIRILTIGSMGRLDWLLWPFSWLAHAAFYRGQWAVEVVDMPDGFWRSAVGSASLVFSRTLPSRREALAERERIADRIQALARVPQSG